MMMYKLVLVVAALALVDARKVSLNLLKTSQGKLCRSYLDRNMLGFGYKYNYYVDFPVGYDRLYIDLRLENNNPCLQSDNAILETQVDACTDDYNDQPVVKFYANAIDITRQNVQFTNQQFITLFCQKPGLGLRKRERQSEPEKKEEDVEVKEKDMDFFWANMTRNAALRQLFARSIETATPW